MEFINLEKENYEKNKIILNNGYESQIFVYQFNNKELLIKQYYDLDQVNIDKLELINKLKTNILLLPQKLVNVDEKTIGYQMRYIHHFYPLNVVKKVMTDEDKFNLITYLKEEVLNLRSQDCMYGDFNLNNILSNGKEVYLCDAANIKIGKYNFDQISSVMNEYITRTGSIEGLDFYMLNLLTIYLFNELNYNDIPKIIEETLTLIFNNKEYIEYKGITDNQDCMDICYNMLSQNSIDSLLIDNMENIKRKKFNC